MATVPLTLDDLRTAGLADVDPDVAALLERELERQRGPDRADRVGELHVAVHARGGRLAFRRTSTPRAIPGRRYYGGCEVVDEIEQLAIDRAKALFGAEHANVQPHAGAQTNMAVYFGCAGAGRHDPLARALDTAAISPTGSRSTSPAGSTRSSTTASRARRTSSTTTRCCALAKEHRPKLIVCGGSAYPRTVETWRFREIADEVGALLLCDMAHFAGLVAAGLHPNPVDALRLRHLDDAQDARRAALRVHPVPRGARAGDRSRGLPRHAGRAARARDRGQGDVLQDRRVAEPFRDYQTQVRANADALAADAASRAGSTCSPAAPTRTSCSSTCARTEWTGKDAEERLARGRSITVNRNTVPFDERPPTVASGVRIGTPAATMRGFDEDDFREVGRDHRGALEPTGRIVDALAARSVALCDRRPAVSRASAATRAYEDAVTDAVRSSVTEVTHPLVQHKLGLPARHDDADADVPPARQRADAAADLRGDEGLSPTKTIEIETPLERTERAADLRARRSPSARSCARGSGCSTACSRSSPERASASSASTATRRRSQPVEYYVKLPDDIADRDVILLDPMLATGNSTAAAVDTVKARRRDVDPADRADRRARGDRARSTREHPDVPIVVASVDRGLNEKGYIVPGPRRRRRPALRHEVDADVRRAAGDDPRSSTGPSIASRRSSSS